MPSPKMSSKIMLYFHGNAEDISNTQYLLSEISSDLVFGRSIGSGPATYLASAKPIGMLILMSAYTSIRNIVKDYVGFLGLLVKERFPNIARIAYVKCPILFIHGMRDRLSIQRGCVINVQLLIIGCTP